MKSNFSKILIYVTLAALGLFLAFWLRSEFMDEKNALETEMHLHFVEGLIGLEKTDVKDFFNRKEPVRTKRRLTVFDSVANRKVMFFNDTFPQGLKDSIKLIIKEGSPVWQAEGNKLKIKRIDVGLGCFDSLRTNKNLSDSGRSSGLVKLVETSSEDFKDKEGELNWNAFKGILPQTIFAFLLYSFLILGIYLLQKSHRDQQALLENKNSLIRNITHELQTPIATIAVALEAIQNFNIKEDKAKTSEYIDTSRQQLKNLSESIDRVMLMSKMDDKKEIFYFERTSVLSLLEEAVADLGIQMAAKNIIVENIPINENINANLDKYHFKNVFFNLLDNAIKYGKQNGKIEVGIEKESPNILIKIKDDGVGIASEEEEKIFERFYRITDGDRHDVKGYGLGLSYARQVVEAHGGKIWAESKVGEGSIFFIKIPCSE